MAGLRPLAGSRKDKSIERITSEGCRAIMNTILSGFLLKFYFTIND